MNRAHFQIQLNRLAETFGKAAYGTERAAILWREVERLTDDWITGVVDKFISEFRHAPLITEFREEIAKLRERDRHETNPGSHGIPWNRFACSYCGGNGVYLCQHPSRTGMWAFRCHCEFGERDHRKAIPQFKQAHIDEGFRYYDLETHHREMRLIQGNK